ncbi:MAG: hypothetical protein ABJN84_13625 [Flavobacteriaceae bacterium]
MKYTSYLSLLLKTRGMPHFTEDQYRTAMNVLSLENRIDGIARARRLIPFNKDSGKLDLLIYKEERKLTEITGNSPVEHFWEQLFNQ